MNSACQSTFGIFSGYKINNKSVIMCFWQKVRGLTLHCQGIYLPGRRYYPPQLQSPHRCRYATYQWVDKITHVFFFYLFQSILLSPPSSFFFQLLKKTFSNFIRNNKRPRLPNLLRYFWAVQIRAGMFYSVPLKFVYVLSR